VGFLDRAEQSIEAAVGSLFARLSNAELQPVEITQAIRNAMDMAANKAHDDRVLVPHRFLILVNPAELQKFTPQILQAIKTEVSRHAVQRSHRVTGEIDLSISSDSKVARGSVKVGAAAINDLVTWKPVLSFDGQTHELKTGTTSVGRDDEADIKVEDRGLSRVHFEIGFDGQIAAIRDLQSTNGTFVDGSKISELVLRSGSTISAGRTEFNFELMAMAGETSE
jgi:hypothetical protein